MKKILSLFICLFVFNAIAQTGPEDLFNLSDEGVFGESTEQTFTGKPIVLINRKQTPKIQVNKAEQLPPPDLRKNALDIPIKTLFGHDRTAAFIDHTTDFLIIAQVLDRKTIQVTEQIQFITTTDGEKFTRFLPNKVYGLNGKETLLKREILSLKRDHTTIPFEISTTLNGTEIVFEKPLPKGVHQMTLEYLIFNPFTVNQSLAELVLPITGPNWKQMTERMTILVMMPKKSRFYEKELLFGSNNQKIPENTKISVDEKGVLTFQNTHPLPAYADVRMHLILDAQYLTNASTEENLNLSIIVIFALILGIYTILSIITARLKKWKKPLAESKKINPILWAVEVGEISDDYQVNLIKNSAIRFAQLSAGWKKVLAFLRFNIEYMVGVILLILATKYVALYYHLEISVTLDALFLSLSLVAVLIIDYYGSRIQMKHLSEILKKTLLDEPQGLNLAKREIPTYYQIAVCLGFQEIWKKRLVENNPSYKDLTCFIKEK